MLVQTGTPSAREEEKEESLVQRERGNLFTPAAYSLDLSRPPFNSFFPSKFLAPTSI